MECILCIVKMIVRYLYDDDGMDGVNWYELLNQCYCIPFD